MADPYGLAIKYMNADGQVFTGPKLVKQLCTMHSTGASGQILMYDKASAPGEGDVPKCKIDIVGTGMFTIAVPEPGALFDNGLYVDLPDNVTANFFYMDHRVGRVK